MQNDERVGGGESEMACIGDSVVFVYGIGGEKVWRFVQSFSRGVRKKQEVVN